VNKLHLALTAVAAALASGTALADPPTGSRLGDHRRPGPTLTAKDQAVGAKRMALCVYNRKETLARQTLLALSKEAQDAAMAKLMGEVQCFGAVFSNDLVEERRVSFPPEIMRGMLAEAALDRSRAEADALQPLPLQQVYERKWFTTTGRHVSVDEMGACIADTNPAGIAALIRTEPGSKEENVWFGGLMDYLGKCLRAGVKLQASRPALRAALAEALFQRFNAPTPAQPVEAAKK
jgi:hypothetical protein